MKYVKCWEEEEDDYVLFASPPKKKGQKKQFKGRCATVERLDTKQEIVLKRKARKKTTLKTNPTKKRHKNLKTIAKERVKPIWQKVNATIVEKWVSLPGTVQNHAKMLILLEKVSNIEKSVN